MFICFSVFFLELSSPSRFSLYFFLLSPFSLFSFILSFNLALRLPEGLSDSDSFDMSENVDIVSPMDPDDEVTPLPIHQFPYGVDCPLDRRFQSVMFHHDVSAASVAVLAQAQILSVKQVRFLNPDAVEGTDERALFHDIVLVLSCFKRKGLCIIIVVVRSVHLSAV